MIKKFSNKSIILNAIFLFILIFAVPVYAADPNVTLITPTDGQNFTTTNNVTFTCNATDDYNVWNLSLYHNISGAFELNQTRVYGEFANNSNTLLLCHFNNNYTCVDGETGTNSSTSFEPGKFRQSVLVNNTDTLLYSTTNNFDRNQGTIEFWIKPYFNVSTTSNGSKDFIDLINITGVDPWPNEFYIFFLKSPSLKVVRFMIADQAGSLHHVQQNVSSWQVGEWYHIAVVWNLSSPVSGNNRMELYIDGSNAGNIYYNTNSNIPLDGTPPDLFVGSYIDGTSNANSTIDELRISDIFKTASEINQSYQNGIGNYINVSANWTINNIPDGNYSWNCLAYDNDSQSDWGDANYSFLVDINPPTISSITLTPNSTDDIDPGTNITVEANVSDISSISVVIFQYKWHGVQTWTNVTMNNISDDEWNTSFTPDLDGIWNYRIWSNDTFGHSVYSTQENISVEKDYTWVRSPVDFGDVYIFKGTIGSLGILIINNTGDYPLNFNLSYSAESPDITVSYNVTESFDLYAGNVTYVNVNASAPETQAQYWIQITINATTDNADPSFLITNATLISYIGGPYLDVSIVDYPITVNQSQTVNLSVKVKNIGNETATNTWLNWTLPTGWTNTSGNLSQNITSLANGSTAWNNITVNLDASLAGAGIATIYANASCAENVNGSDSKLVIVGCNSTDGVCGAGCNYGTDSNCPSPEPQRIGVGGILTVAAQEYGITVKAPSRVDINRGQTKTFLVNISNHENNTVLNDITLSVTGYLLAYVDISPESISEIDYNETKQFTVEVTVPTYMGYKEYTLNITAKGNGTSDDETEYIQAETTALLIIHVVVENATFLALDEANRSIQEMENANFATTYIDSLLIQANNAADEGNYDIAKELAEEIIQIKEEAFRIYDLIQEVRQSIERAKYEGLPVPETEKMYALSVAAFEREDYVKAKERVNNALLASIIETKAEFNILRFIYNYWWAIAIAAVLLIIAGTITRRRILLVLIARELKSLKREEITIEELRRDLQKKYFKEEAVAVREYDKSLSDYGKGLIAIEKRRAKLLSKRIGIIKFIHPIENLKREDKRIRELMRDVQQKYFVTGSIAKGTYKRTMDELNAEKVLIEKNIETEKIRMIERSGGRTYRLLQKIKNISSTESSKRKGLFSFILLIIFMSCISSVYGQEVVGNRTSALGAIEAAERHITEMQGFGFGVMYANDTLNEARILFSQESYMAAELMAMQVAVIKQNVIDLDRLIDDVEGKIYEASARGVNVSPAMELFNRGLEAFETEDYTGTENFMTQAFNKIDEIETEMALTRALEKSKGINIIEFISEYWWVIISSVAVLSVVLFFAYKKLEVSRTVGKLKNLEREKESIQNLIKETQKRYFKHGKISKNEYDIAMGKYEERLIRIKKDIPTLRKKLKKPKIKKKTKKK